SVVSLAGSDGLIRRAMRLAAGTISRSNCMRLATSSLEKKLTPVALPPGRLRLATKPSLTGSPATPNTIGIVVVAALAASPAAVVPGVAITLTCRRTRSATSSGKRIILTVGPAEFGDHVPALDKTAISKPLPERCNHLRAFPGGCHVEKSYHRHCRLLRACRERPRGCRAANQRDEIAPFHCAIPPVRSTQRIAHVSYGGRLLRCGSQVESDAQA